MASPIFLKHARHIQNMNEANPSETIRAETFTKTELVHALPLEYPDDPVTSETADLTVLAMVENVPRLAGL